MEAEQNLYLAFGLMVMTDKLEPCVKCGMEIYNYVYKFCMAIFIF